MLEDEYTFEIGGRTFFARSGDCVFGLRKCATQLCQPDRVVVPGARYRPLFS